MANAVNKVNIAFLSHRNSLDSKALILNKGAVNYSF